MNALAAAGVMLGAIAHAPHREFALSLGVDSTKACFLPSLYRHLWAPETQCDPTGLNPLVGTRPWNGPASSRLLLRRPALCIRALAPAHHKSAEGGSNGARP